ncbi:regulatory particle non-ATPase [Entomophthora muscae]|uniref:Regulatory particle non-ATPase n=1 Tax=Entomophthora muscae TaxID=34485 RepID=A0ACC2RWX0_9FUNG|nr:regulatory particle non-ATPase [Entomophthora muscae]
MSNFSSLYQKLQKQFSAGDAGTDSTLSLLKIELAKASYLSGSNMLSAEQLAAARDILEIGALWSIRCNEMTSFERYITQLHTFYCDYSAKLPKSPRQNMMTGLQLMNLIAQNRIAEFHLALESIDPMLFESDPNIRHPVELEKALMEGSYNKVLNTRDQVPAPEFGYFMNILVTTIQNEIASCCEKAYRSLPIQQIATMLFFNKGDDILAFASQRSWTVNADHTVVFRPKVASDSSSACALPTHRILGQAMDYAKELERIV